MGELIPAASFLYFCIMVTIILLNIHRKKYIELLNPVVFYSILWSIPFAVVPLLIYFKFFDQLDILNKEFKDSDILISQIMAILSLVFLYLGFQLGNKITFFKRKLAFFNKKWSNFSVLFIFSLYFFLILIFVKNGIETGSIFRGVSELKEDIKSGGINYFLSIFNISNGSIFYMAFLPLISLTAYSYFSRKLYLILAIVSSAFLIGIGIYTSQKELIASVLLVILFYLYYIRKSITFKKELIVFIFLVMFFFSFPFFNLYRGHLKTLSEKPDITEVITFAIENYDPYKILQNLNYLFLRFDHLNTNLFIITSNNNFKFGYTYLSGLFSFLAGLPKMPKEGSPLIDIAFNNTFGREYGIIDESNYDTYITLTSFTEVYMNFGLLAIPFFMFLIGVIYRKIYNLLIGNNPNANFLGFILWYIVIFQGSGLSFSSIMFQFGKMALPLIMILIILNAKISLKVEHEHK
jgi:oligosaccharide repeat unit polymerase